MSVARQQLERSGLSRSEAEVLRRHDAGQHRDRIAAETGIHPEIVAKAIGLSSESGSVAMMSDLRSGSIGLRDAVAREAKARGLRLAAARSTGTVANPLTSESIGAVMRLAVAGDDLRPFARGRDPCPRCNTRGDIGCRHQRPDPDLLELQGLDPP